MASNKKYTSKDIKKYVEKGGKPFGNKINDFYEYLDSSTQGGTVWDSDPNVSTWQKDIYNKDEGFKNFRTNKQQALLNQDEQDKALRLKLANEYGFTNQEKYNADVLHKMLTDSREGRPGEKAENKEYWSNYTLALQGALENLGIDPNNYKAETKEGQGFQLQEDGTRPAKDRSNLSFDSIVEEVIPGADPNNLTDEQKNLVAEAIANEPGYTPGDRTKAILGDERIADIMSKRDADNANTDKPVGEGLLDRLKAKSTDLNARKADPNAIYTGIPGENARGDIQGYRSIINDVKDLAYANNDLKDARLNDPVRQEAIAAKKEAKDTSDAIKKYDREYTNLINDLEKTNKKSERMLIKGMINERKARLDELQNSLDEINSNFEKQYGMTINDALAGSDKNVAALEAAGIDPEALSALAGKKYNEITDLLGQRAQVNEELDYISNDIKGDIELLLDGNADPSQLEAVYAKLEKLEPKLRETLNNKVNLNKNTLDALGDVVDSLGDDDAKELYQNLQGMAQGFLEQKIDITDENTLKVLDQYSKEFDDIIKNQEMYDKDTRYASDLRLSSFNRMMFNIFDDIKSAIVFLAAIESGNPQVIRSALDQYNYKLQDAENKRKTDQYGAYTENRIREITQDNIARFKKITEIDPDIAKLERVLNIQEGEAGKRQMDALEAGFEEFNKYKSEHPNESIDFAAWVSANRNAGGVLGQIISALLMNFPDLKNAATNLYQSMGETNDTSSDETKKEDITNISGTKKRTSSILDGVVGKLSEKSKPEQKDPALMMDIQNTVGQALAARAAPPQAGAPQAGAPKTNNGFGRTNLA